MADQSKEADDRNLRIKERAYELWQREGGKEGLEQDHWYRAEAEIAKEEAQSLDGKSAPLSSKEI